MKRTISTTGKQIAAFTVYSAFERVLIVLSGMISLIIIGKLRKHELAGGSISNTVINIFQVPFLSLGTAAMIAISTEEKEKRRIAYNVLSVGVFISLLLLLFLTFFNRYIVELLFGSSDARIKEITATYLSVYKWSIPFVAIDLITSGCMRGWKDAKVPLTVTLLGNLINIILCILFVQYMKTGYIGGAHAQVISSAVVCATKIIYVFKAISQGQADLSKKICFSGMWSIFTKSMPFLLNLFFVRIGFLGMQAVTALLGIDVLTGYQVANNMLSIIYAVTGGVEVSVITFVSKYYAEKNTVKARKVAYILSGISTFVLSCIGIFIALYTPAFAEIFNRDVSTSKEALYVIRLMCITIPVTSFFQCIQGVLNAVKHAKTVALSTILCTWCLRIPASYILAKYFSLGFIGLFIGFMADYLIRAVLYGVIAKKHLK